ncbi:hypothetical protein ANCDUO_12316, partial [Ancylostoma duodenale]
MRKQLPKDSLIGSFSNEIETKLANVFDREVAPRSISKQQQSLLTSTQILRIPGQTQAPSPLGPLRDDSDGDASQSRSPAVPKKRVDYEVAGSQHEDSVHNETADDKGRRVFQFESLNNLRRKICDGASQPLRELFKSLTFVGCVSPSTMLLQFGTGLYVIQLRNTLIFSFGNFGSFKLAEGGANILELLQLAGLENEHEMAALELLESQAEMLNDYFSLQIARPDGAEHDADGLRQLAVVTLPSVIDGYTPQLEGLPALMMSLVKDVNWEE